MPRKKNLEYFTIAHLMERFHRSASGMLKLRKHPDPNQRFPAPTMIQGSRPLWAIEDVLAYEQRQKEYSPARKPRLPTGRFKPKAAVQADPPAPPADPPAPPMTMAERRARLSAGQ